MHLVFNAQEVDYGEALDGEIKHVSFQEEPFPELDYGKRNCPLPPPIKSVSFSVNYEFPPYDITVDWCDGKDDDGGELIKEIQLTNTSLKMELKNGFYIDVSFQTDDITFANIQRFLIGANK